MKPQKDFQHLIDSGKLKPHAALKESFLKLWDKSFSEIPAERFHAILTKGLPSGTVIDEIYLSSDRSSISFTLKNEMPRFSLDATVQPADRSILLADVAVEEDFQGTGIAKKLIANLLALSDAVGAEKWHFNANKKGAYAWLKYGGLPGKKVWEPSESRLNNAVEERLEWYAPQLEKSESGRQVLSEVRALVANPDPKALWKIADKTERVKPAAGLAVPIKVDENGTATLGKCLMLDLDWFGSIDTRYGSESRDRLIKYAEIGKDTHTDKMLKRSVNRHDRFER